MTFMHADLARTRMTVGELSRLTGVPVKTLREYTNLGLIYTWAAARPTTGSTAATPCGAWSSSTNCAASV
ncbi:MerR family DNA-binding transcriptional regulator [Streptomyces sp. NPDC052107]|uniref:MerR family DNA-binding transcriptional regulator n=1 Tax=Streptomyces sp. NPDC052107 TaxID=3155632 RepID=UPI003426CDB1